MTKPKAPPETLPEHIPPDALQFILTCEGINIARYLAEWKVFREAHDRGPWLPQWRAWVRHLRARDAKQQSAGVDA
jgi:hypothetical protein